MDIGWPPGGTDGRWRCNRKLRLALALYDWHCMTGTAEDIGLLWGSEANLPEYIGCGRQFTLQTMRNHKRGYTFLEN